MMQKIPKTGFCIIISINRVMTAVWRWKFESSRRFTTIQTVLWWPGWLKWLYKILYLGSFASYRCWLILLHKISIIIIIIIILFLLLLIYCLFLFISEILLYIPFSFNYWTLIDLYSCYWARSFGFEIEIKCLRLNIYLDKGYYLPNDRLVI
jgi:hypothetical protein